MKNAPGRPEVPFDKEQFETLCAMHCTVEEIAAVLKMSPQSLYNKVHQEYGVPPRQVFVEKKEVGRAKLRSAMWNKALGKAQSEKMQVWLSKQFLGYSEKVFSVETQLQQPMVIQKLDGSQEILGTKLHLEKLKEPEKLDDNLSDSDSGSGQQLDQPTGLSEVD